MIEVGTLVHYHGSIEALHGQTFTVARHCCDGTRHVLNGDAVLRHVRAASITPVDQPDPRAELERAIAAELPVMITYVAADGEWTTRTIEPYELTETRTGEQLVRAMDRRSGETRSFRLDRIHALNVMPGGVFLLDHTPIRERAALARIRAEIREVDPVGYGYDGMRWTPDSPIPVL
ncbi:WYL domain-containing protein [Microbispora sp. NPDC004025]